MIGSQYTVWCWVLIDAGYLDSLLPVGQVSIHRVVLGAYRPGIGLFTAISEAVSIHRVVLGAYRLNCVSIDVFAVESSQYTVWCWVLIDFVNELRQLNSNQSQYTVWCWVLIDLGASVERRNRGSLNTPCGAGCLSTLSTQTKRRTESVSIHRVVLGAYRPKQGSTRRLQGCLNTPCGAGCLSTCLWTNQLPTRGKSQYTVWCWVLIDPDPADAHTVDSVSIHRVVLGAYRQNGMLSMGQGRLSVSIHRVVLGAYRLKVTPHYKEENPSQYTVWCWVLIDSADRPPSAFAAVPSQYTVWCWVLIDPTEHNLVAKPIFCLNTPCGAGCLSTATFTSRTTTPLTLR